MSADFARALVSDAGPCAGTLMDFPFVTFICLTEAQINAGVVHVTGANCFFIRQVITPQSPASSNVLNEILVNI